VLGCDAKEEEPSGRHYELAINLKTAKALGISVPMGCSLVPTR
jgi:hypothetical protein